MDSNTTAHTDYPASRLRLQDRAVKSQRERCGLGEGTDDLSDPVLRVELQHPGRNARAAARGPLIGPTT